MSYEDISSGGRKGDIKPCSHCCSLEQAAGDRERGLGERSKGADRGCGGPHKEPYKLNTACQCFLDNAQQSARSALDSGDTAASYFDDSHSWNNGRCCDIHHKDGLGNGDVSSQIATLECCDGLKSDALNTSQKCNCDLGDNGSKNGNKKGGDCNKCCHSNAGYRGSQNGCSTEDSNHRERVTQQNNVHCTSSDSETTADIEIKHLKPATDHGTKSINTENHSTKTNNINTLHITTTTVSGEITIDGKNSKRTTGTTAIKTNAIVTRNCSGPDSCHHHVAATAHVRKVVDQHALPSENTWISLAASRLPLLQQQQKHAGTCNDCLHCLGASGGQNGHLNRANSQYGGCNGNHDDGACDDYFNHQSTSCQNGVSDCDCSCTNSLNDSISTCHCGARSLNDTCDRSGTSHYNYKSSLNNGLEHEKEPTFTTGGDTQVVTTVRKHLSPDPLGDNYRVHADSDTDAGKNRGQEKELLIKPTDTGKDTESLITDPSACNANSYDGAANEHSRCNGRDVSLYAGVHADVGVAKGAVCSCDTGRHAFIHRAAVHSQLSTAGNHTLERDSNQINIYHIELSDTEIKQSENNTNRTHSLLSSDNKRGHFHDLNIKSNLSDTHNTEYSNANQKEDTLKNSVTKLNVVGTKDAFASSSPSLWLKSALLNTDKIEILSDSLDIQNGGLQSDSASSSDTELCDSDVPNYESDASTDTNDVDDESNDVTPSFLAAPRRFLLRTFREWRPKSPRRYPPVSHYFPVSKSLDHISHELNGTRTREPRRKQNLHHGNRPSAESGQGDRNNNLNDETNAWTAIATTSQLSSHDVMGESTATTNTAPGVQNRKNLVESETINDDIVPDTSETVTHDQTNGLTRNPDVLKQNLTEHPQTEQKISKRIAAFFGLSFDAADSDKDDDVRGRTRSISSYSDVTDVRGRHGAAWGTAFDGNAFTLRQPSGLYSSLDEETFIHVNTWFEDYGCNPFSRTEKFYLQNLRSEEPAQTNMDISTGHIVLAYMEDHLANKARLDEEWEGLQAYEAEPNTSSVAQDPANTRKNRYQDVLPYDHSRVVLNAETNVCSSDYINASSIMDHDPRNPAYIATQGPLPHTVADFWQMVWEQGSVVIVNLTKLTEDGSAMCHRYWPEEGSDLYHIYEVHLVSEHIWCDDYLVRSLYLKNLQTNETRTVTQFHFVSWPDLGVPAAIKVLLDFRRKVNKSYRGRSCPIAIHCSDGVGRTGAYCLIDMVLNRMSKGAKEIDIAATLEHIRDQRMGMVKTKAQFELALSSVAEEVNSILKALPSS